MTTSKTITGAYSGGYTLTSGYSPLTITSSGSIGGTGLTTQAAATIDNYGQVVATTGGDTGINLAFGGSIVNAGAVGGGNGATGSSSTSGFGGFGGFGVVLASNGALTNSNVGVITGGAGGTGGASSSSTGGFGGAGRAGVSVGTSTAAVVTNSGSIGGGKGGAGGAGGFGAFQYSNGFGGQGGGGIAGVATIVNTGGVITGGAGGAGYFAGAGGYGVDLGFHGSINNSGTIAGGAGGAAVAITGSPQYPGRGGAGGSGVDLEGAATLINSGSIIGGAQGAGRAPSNARSYGVYIDNSGAAITNSGLISGRVGLGANSQELFTVTNSGTIESSVGATGTALKFTSSSDRLILQSGATFIGAIAGDGGALEISTGSDTITGLGATGTLSSGAAGTFSGFGAYTIDSGASVQLTGSNKLTSTMTNDGTLSVSGSLVNSGSITGTATFGVVLSPGGYVNDSGFIEGATGAYVDSLAAVGATLVVSGTIEGTSGDSVKLGRVEDRLVVQTGADFIGTVAGGGGTVELASGADTISGLGGSGALSGSATASNFGGFDSYVVDNGASLTLAGAATLTSSQTITSQGVLDVSGAFTNQGSIGGASGITLTGSGSLDNAAGATVSGSTGVYGGSAATATITAFGTIDGTVGNSVQFASASDRLIVGSGADFSGAIVGGGGTLELAGGSDTISGLGGAGAISGSATASSFSGFGSYAIDSAATVTLQGGSLASGQSLVNSGTVDQTGAVTLAAGLDNASGATWDFTTDDGLAGSGGALTNEGLLEKTGGTGTSAIAAGVTDTGVITANSGTIEFDGSVNSFGGSINGTGAVAFGGGASTLQTGASLGVASLDLTGAGTKLALGTSLTYGGDIDQGAGTILALGANSLTLGGTGSILAGVVNGTGTLILSGGSDTVGTNLAMSAWNLSGAAAVGLSANLSYHGSFTQDASTLTLAGHNLSLYGATSFAGGAIDGGVVYAEAASALGGLTLGGGAIFENFAVATQSAATTLGDGTGTGEILNQSAGTLDFTTDTGVASAGSGGSLVNRGLLEKTAGAGTSAIAVGVNSTGVITAATGTLEFDGASNSFAGSLTGAGTVAFGGGVSVLKAATVTVANLAVTGSGTRLVLGASYSYGGGFSQGAGTLLALGANNLTLTGSASILAGAVSGTGALTLSGGGDTVGGTLAMSAWTISGGAAVSLSANLNYHGAFTQDASTITLAGHNLALYGATSFAGGAVDGGVIYAEAASSLGGLTLGGGAVLDNFATATQTAATTLGDGSGTGEIFNQSAGIIDFTGDTGIAISGAGDSIVNKGTFEKTGGSGTSLTSAAVTNYGTIEVTSGTLEFGLAVTGSGSAAIAGGTLAFDGFFGQSVAFTGSTGVLQLDDSQQYGGTVTGLSTSGTNSLDLRDITYTDSSKPTASFSGGVLTVRNGSEVARIHLAGSYANGSFQLSSDSFGGTTVINSPAASTNAFVAAMASFAPGTGVSSAGATTPVQPATPTLIAPLPRPGG